MAPYGTPPTAPPGPLLVAPYVAPRTTPRTVPRGTRTTAPRTVPHEAPPTAPPPIPLVLGSATELRAGAHSPVRSPSGSPPAVVGKPLLVSEGTVLHQDRAAKL